MTTSFRFKLSPRACFYAGSAVIFLLWAGSTALFIAWRNDDWLITRLGGDAYVYTNDSPGHWTQLIMPRPGDSILIGLGDPVTKRNTSFWTRTPNVSVVPIPLVSDTGIKKPWWKTVKMKGGIESTWTEHFHMEYYYPFRDKKVGGPQSETHVPDRTVEFTIADDPDNAWLPAGQPVSFTCSAEGYTEQVTLNLFPASADPDRIRNAADKVFQLPTFACALGAMLCTLLLVAVIKTDKSNCYWRWPRR